MKDQFQIHSSCEGTLLQVWLYFLNLQILQVQINFSFWWNVAYDETTSDDVITSGAPSLQER